MQGIGLCVRHAAGGAHAAHGGVQPVGEGVCIERAAGIQHEHEVLHQQLERGHAVA